ncbi:rho guanine nucleotide exchange factor 39 isoform X1 [Sphaerodactylus townsendi]|uniref:rho guanine nucleotide exchange factor 39 isoform X1 n=1 Tax=Sphaerodactylus townsendi TaxID=933632 RepID=UPI002026D80C|nr:rho guanine nucleotide exchange factor 39 isoform X1 [Sphaerodactylus townsendi]
MAAAGPDGRSCVHVAEQRARWERRRRRAAQELVGSEQRYLEQLDLVATFFVAILKAKGTLKPAVLEALFGPWESVCSASRTLVFHLERGHLALGLEGFRHQVVLYRHYAENFAQAKKTLQKQVRKNKSFVRFKKLQEARPEFKGSRLEDVLPLPLQRLPQYKCLLEVLVENTFPDSSEFEQLTGVLKSVSEVLHQVQEISRFHENSCQMSRVQKLLKGQKIQLLAPGRPPLNYDFVMLLHLVWSLER